jgi:hypothetical protein
MIARVGIAALLALVAIAAAVVPAHAAPIPGASYSGVAANGDRVEFTLSPDGTLVTSYLIAAAGNAGPCMITAEGDNGFWAGAPIIAGKFEYRFYNLIQFRGTFTGSQSVTGTLRLTGARSSGPPCDTGNVSFTATTAARPPQGSGGSGPGGGQGGSGQSGSGQPGSGAGQSRSTFATRLTLRKLRHARIGGRVLAQPSCRGGRTVILWRGQRRIARAKSKANGTFSFARSKAVRRHRIRVSSPLRSVDGGVCDAGSSTFIRA